APRRLGGQQTRRQRGRPPFWIGFLTRANQPMTLKSWRTACCAALALAAAFGIGRHLHHQKLPVPHTIDELRQRLVDQGYSWHYGNGKNLPCSWAHISVRPVTWGTSQS